jgi:DNA-binding transcriptional LysR family regulator
VQIRQLESALGLRLFDRNNRRVALTQAGRDLVAPFERVLLDLDAVVHHARDLAAHRRGAVTVAALPSVAADLLPRAIRRLADRHAGIVIRVRDALGDRIVDLVKSGEVDFGVGSLVRPDPDIETTELLRDRLWAFVPVSHPLARARDVRLRDLSAHPLILTSRDSSVRQIVERAFEQQDLPLHVAQEATYMTTAIGMARAGLGVAVLPRSAIATGTDPDIRPVPIRSAALTRPIAVLRRTSRSFSPAAQTLVDTLRDVVRHRGTAARLGHTAGGPRLR